MDYSNLYISKVKARALELIYREIDQAVQNNTLEQIIEKYGLSLDDGYIPVTTRTMRIIVIGALAGNVHDFKKAAKKHGINEDNIEFVSDYSKLKRFNGTVLKNSFEYSEIIYGPNPHKQVEIGDFSSALSEIKAKPNEYPRLLEAKVNNHLKLKISGFIKLLYRTRYYETLVNQ